MSTNGSTAIEFIVVGAGEARGSTAGLSILWPTKIAARMAAPEATAIAARCHFGRRVESFGRLRRQAYDLAVQPVAAFWHRLEHGLVALIAAGEAELPAQFVEAARERVIRHHLLRPQAGQQAFAQDDVPGALGQHHENVHDLGIELFSAAGTGYLAGVRVDREVAEPEALLEWVFSGWVCRFVHLRPGACGYGDAG